VIGAGIGLTQSRGGILAALASTAILMVLAPVHRRVRGSKRRFLAAGSLALMLGLGFVAVVSGEAALLRFLGSDPRDLGSDERVKIWRASIEAWERSPLVGTGLGTFREAFRRVQPADVRGLVEHAHNDFLQILVTGGWIGATLAVLAYLAMVVLLVQAWTRQSHREESAVALAAIGALIALALHGLVEFNLSIPAIPVTLAVMTGVGWAAARAD
jgi:O-antigen ligase